MTEATIIINDALQMCGISSEFSPPTKAQQSRSFGALYGMIAGWINQDLDMMIVQPYEISDDIGEEPHLTEDIKALLSEKLCVIFQTEPEPFLAKQIAEARESFQILFTHASPTLPCNLPRGAGNKRHGYRPNPYFSGKKTTKCQT
jgi:hypothetical protein